MHVLGTKNSSFVCRLLLLALLAILTQAETGFARRPNIVLLLADDKY